MGGARLLGTCTRSLVLIVLFVAACGEPDAKLNSAPNGTPNNTSNNGSNNNTSNIAPNVDPNNAPGPIDPTNYDQTCTVEDDCMLIRSGEVCGCEPCMDAAINVSDQQALADDIAAAMCGDIACPAVACGEDQRPHCNVAAGMCEVRIAKFVAADDWDRGCSVDEDCVGVFEGEICAPCQGCANTAINVAELDAYQAEFDVVCHHGVDCACAPPEVFCNEGLCMLID